ncbi:hypothetical protein KCU61_g4916, partial [Aureobasidium melanogenum]
MSDLKKPDVEEIEKIYEHGSSDVQLIVNNETVLLPIPSEDPKDPLNLPPWRKWAILVIVSAFSCSAAVLASGLGPIFPMIVRDYPGQELKANDLQTYPTLFMGIGNMLSLPITNVVGRRSIFLASIILLIVGGIWCAYSQSLESHIAGRMVMSLAAGQSEALSPMIVQEIHFLHERGRKLGWFIFIQNFTVGIFFFSETYMVSAWGWRWWYGFFTIFNAVVFLLAFPLASETLWIRPDAATEGVTGVDTGIDLNELTRVTTAHGNTIRPDIHGPRTWRSDLKLFTKRSSWDTVPVFYLDLLKGAQILVCIGFLPLLGYGSDLVIKFMSQRNNGTYKPEYRLLLLIIPGISTLICVIIYGQAAQYPAEWNRLAVAFPYNFIFFGFLGANIVGITYGIDSFPLKAAPVLVVICAGRGLISFGLSYAVLPSIAALGYDGIMNILGGLTAGITVLAIPIYFFGPYLRRLGRIYYGFGESKTYHGAH